ncbi:MAG: FkbM family methyltransferase [Clostridiales bacterium]|nr:FkbM family methyltransferase [Clostridiales bacterium]
MGLIDKTGKKVLSKLPDLKIISLARDVMPYISVEAEGLTFFFKNTDHSILDYMVESRKIWACEDMDYILGYYDSISKAPAAVIDIGANVGTSVIYFRNKLGADTKFFAVEPVTDNFNLLKANCAINGFSDINAFRLAISDAAGEADLEINPANMATCKIAGSDSENLVFGKDETSYVGDKVPLMPLDSFVSKNKIATDSPVLFWIDVEGHEPEVFKGGRETFRNTDAVVFCEFNPKLYKHVGSYEGFLNDIKSCFGKFLCYEQSSKGKYEFRDIAEIDQVAVENNDNQCNLLLIK